MNLFFAFVASFLWGTTYAVTQSYLSGWPPLLLGALRAFPAGVMLFALRPDVPSPKMLFKLSVTGIINIGIFFICIFIMALTLPSAISCVGMMSVPVFAMVVQWVLSKKAPSILQAISGIGLIVFAAFLFDPGAIQLDWVGLVAMLIAVLCIILGSLLTQKIGSDIHWWTVVTWQLLAGGIVLVILSVIDASRRPDVYMHIWHTISADNILGLAWIILLNTALSYSLYVWVLQRISLVEFTFSSVANPMAGVLCGLVLLGENYTLSQYGLMVGMVMMSLLPNAIKACYPGKLKKKSVSEFK